MGPHHHSPQIEVATEKSPASRLCQARADVDTSSNERPGVSPQRHFLFLHAIANPAVTPSIQVCIRTGTTAASRARWAAWLLLVEPILELVFLQAVPELVDLDAQLCYQVLHREHHLHSMAMV